MIVIVSQFISVMILYSVGTNLTDFQFLYIDLFVICSLSAVFGRTKPFRGPLHNRAPMTSLLSPPPIGSLIIQIVIICFFQAMSLIFLQMEPWFVYFYSCRVLYNFHVDLQTKNLTLKTQIWI